MPTTRQREDATLETERARALDAGRPFAVWLVVDGKPYPPKFGAAFFRTRADAQARLDEMFAKHDKQVPDDLHARRGSPAYFDLMIEAYENGAWTAIESTRRRGLWTVSYPDEDDGR